MSGVKSYEEFLSEYNNENNYHPEDPKENMSHRQE
ncbi:GH-E family nuclease [Chryseobacterium zhengzhouense]|uniref:GH-E family nuclease n=1 Tax=Chryseobacterium zhengzhouense TaxID=1636086 RepID=A0ABW2M403_9FLAO